jgi:hypothetical protein
MGQTPPDANMARRPDGKQLAGIGAYPPNGYGAFVGFVYNNS